MKVKKVKKEVAEPLPVVKKKKKKVLPKREETELTPKDRDGSFYWKREGKKIYLNLYTFGIVDLEFVLGLSSPDIDSLLENHPKIVADVGLIYSHLNNQVSLMKIKAKRLEAERKRLYSYTCYMLRAGKLPMPVKSTEASIKEVADFNDDYLASVNEYHNVLEEVENLQKEADNFHSFKTALEHKLSMIISKSANWRAEIKHELENLRKDIERRKM